MAASVRGAAVGRWMVLLGLMLGGLLLSAGVQAVNTPEWCRYQIPYPGSYSYVCEAEECMTGTAYATLGELGMVLADCESNPHPIWWPGTTPSYTSKFSHCELIWTANPETANHVDVWRVYEKHYNQNNGDGTFTCTWNGTFYGIKTRRFYLPSADYLPNEGRNNDPSQCDVKTGNPFHVATGVKFQAEQDGQWGDLSFTRHYSSAYVQLGDGFGEQWRHSYSYRIRAVKSYHVVKQAFLYRPTGAQVRFDYNTTTAVWTGPLNDKMRLSDTRDGSGVITAWSLLNEAGDTEVYDADGKLTRIDRRDGRSIHLSYDSTSGLLDEVEDDFGRAISFTYDGSDRIDSLTTPSGELFTYGYNATTGVLETVTYPDDTPLNGSDNPVRTYLYEDTSFPKHLTGITDERGNRYATWDYDTSGRVVLSVHGTDTSTVDRFEATYNVNGTTSVEDPLGQVRVYTVSNQKGLYRLSGLDEPCASCGSNTSAKTYDSNGYLDTATDFNGVVTDYTYNTRGLETQRIEASAITGNSSPAEERTIQTDWHSTLNIPTERRTYDASSTLIHKEAWTYNAAGQVLTRTETDPVTTETRTTTLEYCDSTDVAVLNSTCPVLGLLKEVDGPRTDVTDVTTYAYYPSEDLTGCSSGGTCHRKGDLHTVTNAAGHVVETLRYDLDGRTVAIEDANGVVTEMSYHPRGWLLSRTVYGSNSGSSADDAVLTMTYDDAGLVTRTTQADGSFIDYTYDNAHRLTEIEDNQGNSITYTLDDAGNRTAEETKDPSSNLKRSLSRVYNALGQLTQSKTAALDATVFTYDDQGNQTNIEDAKGVDTSQAYDPLNRLKQVIQDVGGIEATTSYAYDHLGRLETVTDPKGLDTNYTYNAFGDVVGTDSPDTGVATASFDKAGNRVSTTDARSVTVAYGYDVLNRPTSIDYPTSSPDRDVDFFYDQADGTTGCSGSYPKGRLTSMTDETGSTTWCYDHRGNVVKKTQVVGGVTLAVQYAYDLSDRLVEMTYPSGDVIDLTRNSLGQVTDIDHTDASTLVVTALVDSAAYLPFGPLSSLTLAGGVGLTLTHDQNYWTTGVSSNALDLDFTLDAVGNITVLNDMTATEAREVSYDNLYRITGVDDGNLSLLEAFTYDDTGNRLSYQDSSGTESYTYPSTSHRLTQVGSDARTFDAAGSMTSDGSLTFTYDDRQRLVKVENGVPATLLEAFYSGKGERVKKVGGTTELFLYNEQGQLLGRYDSLGAPQQEVVWLDGRPVALLQHSGSYAGELLAVHADHLGSPRAVTRPASSNALVWEWELRDGVFGQDAANEDPDADLTALRLDLRFPGQQFDSETGLHYNYFRDYEPGVGRYVESDPIGLAGGVNTYGYVQGDPLSLFDPKGLHIWIEGPSPGERAGHISFCVGDPAGSYRCFSFGLNTQNEECCLDGEVYEDRWRGGEFISPYYAETTADEDALILNDVMKFVGIKEQYNAIRTCRQISRLFYSRYIQYGTPSTPPYRPRQKGAPSSTPPFPHSITVK